MDEERDEPKADPPDMLQVPEPSRLELWEILKSFFPMGLTTSDDNGQW